MKLTILFLFVAIVNVRAQTSPKPDTVFVIGKVLTLHSQILKEDRVLNIYLPDGYTDTGRYPVIYLLDGSADEDFIHVVGLVQFNTFPWINRIPKSIVVGIANTNRKRDFTRPAISEAQKKMIPQNGGSASFVAFLEHELQPFIDKKYSTSKERTLIGQSLGGLLATDILFTKPGLFSKYIIISPSLWWNDGELLRAKPEIGQKGVSAVTDIYIGVGKEGSIDGSPNHIMEEDAKLLAEKIERGNAPKLRVHYDFLPQENHATVTHQAIFNAFRWLYPVPEKQ